MAFSVNTPVGDGVTKQFAVNFTNGIFSRDSVHVFVEGEVDGLGDPIERTFTWINDGLIELDGDAPASGLVIEIRRIMDKDEPAVDFEDGEILTEETMDRSVDHLLNSIHELLDGYGFSSIQTDINMNGNRVTGLGEPQNPDDAARVSDIAESASAAVLRQEIASGILRAATLSTLESTNGRFDGDAARLVSGTGRDGDFRWNASDLSATLVLASATSDSVDDGTDTINDADHPFSDGDGVITQTTVNGLTAHTVYWVVNSTSGTYQLSATFGGGAIDLTGTTNVTIDHLLDPLQGIWVAPSTDKTGASGAWVRSGKEIRPEHFGDDTAAVQMAEIYASSLGRSVDLTFDLEYPVTGSIDKRSNVNWVGTGKVFRENPDTITGAAFSIVTADSVSNWKISIGLENVSEARVLAGDVTESSAFGLRNSLIHAKDCSDFEVKGAKLKKFSSAVLHWGCSSFSIDENNVIADSGETLAGLLAGTYTAGRIGTVCIGQLWTDTGPASASEDFSISRNRINALGIDIAIEALSQVYDKEPSLVSENRIIGGTAGIQAYRGSFTDLGSAPTYESGVSIQSNYIRYTYNQGIYLRGLVGGQCCNNKLFRTGVQGANGAGAGNTACAIIARINPFDSVFAATFVSAADGDVSDDHELIISGNQITNHGRTSGADNDVVRIELNNVKFYNNTIDRAAEYSTSATGQAVNITGRFNYHECYGNTISGAYTRGINVAGPADHNAPLDGRFDVYKNTLKGAFTNAIHCDSKRFNVNVDDNKITGSFDKGVFLRFTVFGSVSENKIQRVPYDATADGIEIAGGCLVSYQPNLETGGSISATRRRGGSIEVVRNDISGVGDPFAVSETNADDAFFAGRCSRFSDNIVDGAIYFWARSGADVPASHCNIWSVGQRQLNSDVAVGQPEYRVCVNAGQTGDGGASTGDTTAGSPVITNVSDLDGYGIGLYLSISSFTGDRKIVAIDAAASTITVDDNADSNSTGVVLASSIPTFAAAASLVEG